MNDIDISAHEQWFHTYVDSFHDGGEWVRDHQEKWDETDTMHIELKRNHTLRVLENCRALLASMSLAPELHRACLLAACYHDVGRFYQYSRYRTFADPLSTNHGILGCRMLNQLEPLREEPKNIQKLVKGAVALHNRFTLPRKLSPELHTAVSVVRDSDKLDVIAVILKMFLPGDADRSVVALHAKDEPSKWSPAILDALLHKRVALYENIRYQNDFMILICTWVFDLNYAISRRMLRESGHLEEILSLWPKDPRLTAAKEIVREALRC